MIQINELTFLAIRAAIDAGKEILEVYGSEDFDVQIKKDKSPLTQADLRSNDAIKKHLQTSGIAILSEEEKEVAYDARKNWEYFWLVDPLDGTKEFIKKNGEFTVNIALIRKNLPIIGVVYVPATGEMYFANEVTGAYKLQGIGAGEHSGLKSLVQQSEKLPVPNGKTVYTAVGSRSHMSDGTIAFVEQLKQKHGQVEMVSKGSALKLCLVAEGTADIYPRFGPTMEWDTGAGHAVAKFSGALVYQTDNGQELVYNKENLLNPFFIVERK
jgi:3'(2'), 5'-bisphosphate nucleotidase